MIKFSRKTIRETAVYMSKDDRGRVWHIVPIIEHAGTEREYNTYALFCNFKWECQCGDPRSLKRIAEFKSTMTIVSLARELGTSIRALVAFSEDDSLREYAVDQELPESLVSAIREAWANWEAGKHDR